MKSASVLLITAAARTARSSTTLLGSRPVRADRLTSAPVKPLTPTPICGPCSSRKPSSVSISRLACCARTKSRWVSTNVPSSRTIDTTRWMWSLPFLLNP